MVASPARPLLSRFSSPAMPQTQQRLMDDESLPCLLDREHLCAPGAGSEHCTSARRRGTECRRFCWRTGRFCPFNPSRPCPGKASRQTAATSSTPGYADSLRLGVTVTHRWLDMIEHLPGQPGGPRSRNPVPSRLNLSGWLLRRGIECRAIARGATE